MGIQAIISFKVIFGRVFVFEYTLTFKYLNVPNEDKFRKALMTA